MTRDEVIAKVRKLLALEEGSDFEGEIRAAAQAAQELVQRHAIKEAELGEAAAQEEEHFGRSLAFTVGERLSQWESILAKAISIAVGTVHWYYEDGHFVKDPATGIGKRVAYVWFFGPADDAMLAAEMFGDMDVTIATLAILKWTSLEGSGLHYCLGFVQALSAEAYTRSMAKPMAESMGVSTELAVRVRSIIEGKRRRAKAWLKNECGVQLARGRRSGAVPVEGFNVEAYVEGQADGRAHGMSVKRTPQLGAQRSLPARKAGDQ